MSLSTHVLDTVSGRPAAGVAVMLRREGAVVASVETDEDGRATFGDGRRRASSSWSSPSATTSARRRSWTASRCASGSPIADAHYHVPLLVSPWAYSTYRGS